MSTRSRCPPIYSSSEFEGFKLGYNPSGARSMAHLPRNRACARNCKLESTSIRGLTPLFQVWAEIPLVIMVIVLFFQVLCTRSDMYAAATGVVQVLPSCSMMAGEITHFFILSFARFRKGKILLMTFSNDCLALPRSQLIKFSSCTSGARERACASPALIASKNFGILSLSLNWKSRNGGKVNTLNLYERTIWCQWKV